MTTMSCAGLVPKLRVGAERELQSASSSEDTTRRMDCSAVESHVRGMWPYVRDGDFMWPLPTKKVPVIDASQGIRVRRCCSMAGVIGVGTRALQLPVQGRNAIIIGRRLMRANLRMGVVTEYRNRLLSLPSTVATHGAVPGDDAIQWALRKHRPRESAFRRYVKIRSRVLSHKTLFAQRGP